MKVYIKSKYLFSMWKLFIEKWVIFVENTYLEFLKHKEETVKNAVIGYCSICLMKGLDGAMV